jgi:hypothetical protein
VLHHADYLGLHKDQALCGVAFQNPLIQNDTRNADAICPDCEAKLVEYHLAWWREKALRATAELEALRAKYGEPAESVDAEPSRDFTDEAAEPTTLLDHARRELTELCLQFDGAVPYFRLKNAMQAFSDKLETQQRVDLAQEIGADGSLIRWSTTEVESRGWSVINSPVQENTDMMWEEWLHEAQQAPTKAKRRFGRSR